MFFMPLPEIRFIASRITKAMANMISTQMPAVLIEVGFINNDEDNVLFDERFDDIARAIADGILQTIWS